MSLNKKVAATAYSYVRFSSAEQGKGDSVRRQVEKTEQWCERNGITLDTSLAMTDRGVSAFKGTHRGDKHALGKFLELVKQGKVARGSFLIIENLDRLSREDERTALRLWLDILDQGVNIVQLSPESIFKHERSDMTDIIRAIIELSRGHSESRMKAERVGGAWKEKKRAAADSKEPVTKRTPAWLSVEDGAFVVDEEKAAAVRRIYRMAAEGFGLGAIGKRLNAEGVAPIGTAEFWAKSYLCKLLTSRATVGDYQPFTRRDGTRKPDGKVIPDYYPAIVTEDEWHAARAALTSRRQKGGRAAPQVNIFAGLLHDARDGGTLHQMDKGRKSNRQLVSYRATNKVKGARYVSFPFAIFEEAILSQLREIKPRDILPPNDDAEQVLALTGKLAAIEGRLAQLKAQLETDADLGALVDAARSLEEKHAATAEELAAAQHAAAMPLPCAWKSCQGLLDAMDAAEDQEEARTRLRAAVRRVTESIWCLFMAKGAVRIAAVQVWFTGGEHRDYLIWHRGEKANAAARRPAQTLVKSLADAGALGSFDLRDRDHAKRLERALSAIELNVE